MFAKILIGSMLNALITADSGAALTLVEARPTEGSVTVSHDKGDEYTLDACAGRTRLTAEISGANHLSSAVTVDGSVRYSNTDETDRTGTAFIITDDLRPFDIVIDNPGNTTSQTFDFSAGAGWRVAEWMSVGARADYMVGDVARTRDLRYADSYLDLNTSAGLCLHFAYIDVAADAIYRRSVESISFTRAGTTDAVYTPLIDYGNGLGISESYNGTGYTDDTRQPLLSEYAGVSAQAQIRPADGIRLFIAGKYTHRTGHYGCDSQYTIVHDKFSGNSCGILMAVQLGTSVIEARCTAQDLTNYRTNYLSQLVDGVKYYQYYEPTKTAVKTRVLGEVAYTGYFTPLEPGIYRWRVKAGAGMCRDRVTSWLYPLTTDTDCRLVRPFVSLQGTFPLRGKGEIVAEGGAAYQWASGDYISNYNMYTDGGVDISAKLNYTLPAMKALGLRPGIFAGVHTLHRYMECGITIGI